MIPKSIIKRRFFKRYISMRRYNARIKFVIQALYLLSVDERNGAWNTEKSAHHMLNFFALYVLAADLINDTDLLKTTKIETLMSLIPQVIRRPGY